MKPYTEIELPRAQIFLFDDETELSQWATDNPLSLVISTLPGARERSGQVKVIVATYESRETRNQAAMALLQADRLATISYSRSMSTKAALRRATRLI